MKIIFVFAPTNRCDFAIVLLLREVETLSAKTEDLLCFFDLFESFSSIMSPGNRNKLRRLLRLRLLYMRLQRLCSRRILQYSGESLRFRRCSQRTFNFGFLYIFAPKMRIFLIDAKTILVAFSLESFLLLSENHVFFAAIIR